jgi:hypothetical protein
MTLLACDLARDRKSTGAFAIYFLSLRRARNIIARNNISRKFFICRPYWSAVAYH